MSEIPEGSGDHSFSNIESAEERNFIDFLRWRLRSEVKPEEYKPDIVKPNMTLIKSPPKDGITATWIGHATMLIQVCGLNILTDPIYSERCSPFSFIGPKRMSPPGIPLRDLPHIDAVLISHDHYDHLDLPTIKRLGQMPHYFIPIGLGTYFKGYNVTELDWWESVEYKGIKIHCVTARHFSGRSLFTRNKTLWASFILETPAGMIYFAGDTGYSSIFRELNRRYGQISVSFLPIGAYDPRWFMSPMHVNPPEAVAIHRDLQSRLSIAMHWGTFRLTTEPMSEPPIYLKTAMEETGVDKEHFKTPGFGESIVYKN